MSTVLVTKFLTVLMEKQKLSQLQTLQNFRIEEQEQMFPVGFQVICITCNIVATMLKMDRRHI
jgi:hypothetical protein